MKERNLDVGREESEGPLRHVFRRRGELRRQVDEEIAFHLEMRVRELERRGFTRSAARVEAMRRFGDLKLTREVCLDSDHRMERRMERKEIVAEMAQDARVALRQLRRRPGFAAVAVTTLAVGIGANTAIFSAADHVLLRPLPYVDSDRVVTLWETDRRAGLDRGEVAPGNFLAWRERAGSFSALALAEPFGFDFTGDGPPQPVAAWLVTEDFFAAAGVRMLHGRAFLPEEFRPNAGRVVVLSHQVWRDRFAADPGLVGRTIQLDFAPAMVVGVLPPGTEYPRPAKGILAPKVFRESELQERTGGYMQVVARLAPGVTREAAQADMDRVAAQLAAEFPRTNADAGVNLVPLEEHVLGGVRPALLLLLGAVALVLLIACANVASLLLARGAERERELGVRASLGAGRGRLLRQLVTESVVLAALGGAAGVVFAVFGVRALAASSPADLPRLDSIAIDVRVLVFAGVVTLLTALIFGLAPSLQLSRADLRPAVGSGGRSHGGRARTRLRGALVMAEVGLALVLLIGAGLLARSFLRLLSNDLGFAVEDRVSLQLFLWDRNPTAEQRLQRMRELEDAFRNVPGVANVARVSALPFHPSQIDTEGTLAIEGRPVPEGQRDRVQTTISSPGYFEVMQIAMRRGRDFNAHDRAGAPLVAIVNETLARRFFPGEDPVGKRVTIGVMGRPLQREIVGVVADVRPTTLDSDPRAELFIPYEQSANGSVTFVLATTRDPSLLVQTLREQVWAIDADQAIYHTATLDELIRATLVERRFHLLLLGVFSLVALVLATVGIYGLISFATQQRRAEIGVRMALGARRADVTRMIVGDALRLTLPGIVIGLSAALVLTRFMRSMLYGVQPADPLTYLQLALLMLAVAVLAAYLPAWRAARTDPMRVLRQEG